MHQKMSLSTLLTTFDHFQKRVFGRLISWHLLRCRPRYTRRCTRQDRQTGVIWGVLSKSCPLSSQNDPFIILIKIGLVSVPGQYPSWIEWNIYLYLCLYNYRYLYLHLYRYLFLYHPHQGWSRSLCLANIPVELNWIFWDISQQEQVRDWIGLDWREAIEPDIYLQKYLSAKIFICKK